MSSTQVILRHGTTAEAMSGEGGPKGPPFSRPVCRCAGVPVYVWCAFYTGLPNLPPEEPRRFLFIRG